MEQDLSFRPESPPDYHSLYGHEPNAPPSYSPSIQHLGVSFLFEEHGASKGFEPIVIELNSTQLNLYELQSDYVKYANFFFNNLLPKYVDPQLNIKTTSSWTTNEYELFSEQPKTARKGRSKINRLGLLRRLSSAVKLSTKPDSTLLSNNELRSENCNLIHDLLLAKSDLTKITCSEEEYKSRYSVINNLKGRKKYSFSLQELIKFGNASDFPFKPFTLRLLFPQHRLLLASYNSNQFVEMYYKLNIAREISLDLEWRLDSPQDHCVPRRRRRRQRATIGSPRRDRAGSTNTMASSSGRSLQTTIAQLSTYNDDDEDVELQSEDDFQVTEMVSVRDTQNHSSRRRQSTQSMSLTLSHSTASVASSVFTAARHRDSIETDLSDEGDSSAEEMGAATSTLTKSKRHTPCSYSHGKEECSSESIRSDIERYKELIFTLRCMKACKLKHLFD